MSGKQTSILISDLWLVIYVTAQKHMKRRNGDESDDDDNDDDDDDNDDDEAGDERLWICDL